MLALNVHPAVPSTPFVAGFFPRRQGLWTNVLAELETLRQKPNMGQKGPGGDAGPPGDAGGTIPWVRPVHGSTSRDFRWPGHFGSRQNCTSRRTWFPCSIPQNYRFYVVYHLCNFKFHLQLYVYVRRYIYIYAIYIYILAVPWLPGSGRRGLQPDVVVFPGLVAATRNFGRIQKVDPP